MQQHLYGDSMNWLELHITCDVNDASLVGDQLLLLGAHAVTFQDGADQPIYEPLPGATPQLWQQTIVTGLFDNEQTLPPIIEYFEKQQTQGLIKKFQLQGLADQDWVRLGLANFKPLIAGKRLCICPSWIAPPSPTMTTVILDPGLAFGTGTHATTALCLEWLDSHIHSEDLVVDYGCGSGILGIAAIKLGAQKVIAIDHDEQALLATQANAAQNNISADQLACYLPNQAPTTPADVVIANILAKPLIGLAEHFYNLLKENGKIVISGILSTQAQDLIEIYQAWFNIKSQYLRDGWVCIEGIRKSKSC